MGASSGSHASTEPCGLGPPGFDPARSVRRTFKPFASVPRDGTVFHMANVCRFNPCAKQFEMLVYGDDGAVRWALAGALERSTRWCAEMPLPYEVPARKWFGFTMTYLVRRKTRRERFSDWLLAKFPTLKILVGLEFSRLAIAMEARSVETEGLHPKDDSAGLAEASPNLSPPSRPTNTSGEM